MKTARKRRAVLHELSLDEQPAQAAIDSRGERYVEPARYRWRCSCRRSASWRWSKSNVLWGFDRHVLLATRDQPAAPGPHIEEHW